jgi:BirA family transcriptional regulator, biotin operon repressor / biotin---[acetyl-CoA-carboxylase] ligase
VPDRFGDLDRPPLSATALQRSLVRQGSVWTSVEVREQTGSTNADLVLAATSGTGRAGAVLVVEQQTEGRGRLARSWVSPARAGLTFSVLLAPTPPVVGWGWLPLLTGLAVVDGIRVATDVETTLKWPNDVLAADGRKLAGILAERVDVGGLPMAVVGVGLNVSTRADELPVPAATSLALAGADHADRQTLLVCVLRSLDVRLAAWSAGALPVADYRAVSSTLGSDVRVELPSMDPLLGSAVDIAADGRLVVAAADGSRTSVAAGDVTHLR